MYLQSVKSAAKSVKRSLKEKPTYKVWCLYSSFVHGVQVLRNLPAPACQPHLDKGTGGMGVRRKLAALAAAYGACARAVQLLRPLGTRPAHLLNGCGHRPCQGRGERELLLGPMQR
jgi:hypothetical protein